MIESWCIPCLLIANGHWPIAWGILISPARWLHRSDFLAWIIWIACLKLACLDCRRSHREFHGGSPPATPRGN